MYQGDGLLQQHDGLVSEAAPHAAVWRLQRRHPAATNTAAAGMTAHRRASRLHQAEQLAARGR